MGTTLKKIGILWFLYLLLVNGYVLLLGLLGKITVSSHTIKEICFALWGYGWDGMHYIKIATQGYEFPLQAFFPLYPLLIKFFDYFLPLTLAYRVNAFLLLPLLLVSYYLMQFINISERNRIKVLVLFLVFPTGFFLQANYVEALYILLSAVGLLFLLKKKYFWAAIMAGLLSAVKISGISLGLIIAFFYISDITQGFKEWPKDFVRMIGKLLLILLLSFSGFFAYMYYLNTTYGSTTIFFEAQSEWGRQVAGAAADSSSMFFQQYFKDLAKSFVNFDISLFRRLSEILLFVMVTVFLYLSRKSLRAELWLFSLLQVLIPFGSGTLLSFNRLALLAYPVLFFGFERVSQHKKLFCVTLATFIILQLAGIYLFFNNVFIG